MNRKYILTIAIPTYNRNEILIKNLAALIPQINHKCELLIIDNHSDLPISESTKEMIKSDHNKNIRIIRNVANVGGNENILRCVEHAQGEYVWMLGDDDVPFSNAVQNVLDEISANPDAVVINMYADATSHQMRDATRLCKGASGYLRSSRFLGELIFISSLIFSRTRCLRHLATAHLMQSTFAPQLFLALLSLGNDGYCVISNKKTVISGGGTTPLTLQYPSIYVAVGIAGLLDYRWDNEIHNALLRHLIYVRKVWMTPYGIINQLLQISQCRSTADSREIAFRLYRTIGSRLYSLGSIINFEKILFRMGVLALIFPKLGIAAKKILWQIKRKNMPYTEISASKERL